MKNLNLFKSALLVSLFVLLFSCSNGTRTTTTTTPGQTIVEGQVDPAVADNFDLEAVKLLVQEQQDPEILERLIVEQNLSNVDYDENGEADPIVVTLDDEGDASSRYYSFEAVQINDEKILLAEVRIQKEGDQVVVEVEGNSMYYGPGAVYVGYSPYAHYSWLWGPYYRVYRPYYGYSYYHGLYGYRPVVPIGVYRSHYSTYRTRVVSRPGYRGTTYNKTKSSRVHHKNSSRSISNRNATSGSKHMNSKPANSNTKVTPGSSQKDKTDLSKKFERNNDKQKGLDQKGTGNTSVRSKDSKSLRPGSQSGSSNSNKGLNSNQSLRSKSSGSSSSSKSSSSSGSSYKKKSSSSSSKSSSRRSSSSSRSRRR